MEWIGFYTRENAVGIIETTYRLSASRSHTKGTKRAESKDVACLGMKSTEKATEREEGTNRVKTTQKTPFR